MAISSMHEANGTHDGQSIGLGASVSAPQRHARAQHRGAPPRVRRRVATPAFATAVGLVLLAGWRTRGDGLLTAESGAGYALGVAGGTMMLLMHGYSARKRLRWMRRWGRIKIWFQAHMLLGVLGPAAILFHANFGLGSTNSNVALLSMLSVTASGLVGRFLYARITHELYGQRATLRELREELDRSRDRLEGAFPLAGETRARLAALEAASRPTTRGWRASAATLAALPVRARRTRASLVRDLTRPDLDPSARHAAHERVDAYVAALVKEAQFSLYERLFSLWHALHLPLFLLLTAAGIVHVIAVHMY